MRLRLNITPKLTLIFVLFAVLLLAVVSILAYVSGRAALQSAAVAQLLSTAIEKQSALEDWVGDAQFHASALARSPYIQKNLADLQAAKTQNDGNAARAAHDGLIAELQIWVGEARDYQEWSIMDPDSGQIIVSTNPIDEGKFREDQAFFVNGKLGNYVQNVYYSPSTQNFLMTVSVPIFSSTGTLLGVLAGNLDLKKMNEIVNRRTGLRQTDEAFLVNTSELFVTQPRLVSDPAVLRLGVHTQAVKNCLVRNSGVVNALDYRGIPAMIVYRWMPERQLCLIVKMNQAEAFAPVNTLGRNILVISGIALLAAAGLAWMLARTITRPIHQLARGAKEIGSGNLDYRLSVPGKDEISELAEEFDHMAGSIQNMQTQLGQRAEQLESANQELEAFSYSISHDLRAPLRAMDGFSRILVEEYGASLPGEAQRYLGLVRSNAQQMGHLIEDLLTFSRLSRQPLNKQTVDTREVVNQVLEDLQFEKDGRSVSISFGELPACKADPVLLKQVWINLLSNAFKYTRKQENPQIEIGSTQTATECIYFVKDNGVGFDMHYVNKLFGVFQRLHRSEEYEGTGVGLAIVQRIVHRHGGRAWAEAEVNKGAIFYFTLEGGV